MKTARALHAPVVVEFIHVRNVDIHQRIVYAKSCVSSMGLIWVVVYIFSLPYTPIVWATMFFDLACWYPPFPKCEGDGAPEILEQRTCVA